MHVVIVHIFINHVGHMTRDYKIHVEINNPLSIFGQLYVNADVHLTKSNIIQHAKNVLIHDRKRIIVIVIRMLQFYDNR